MFTGPRRALSWSLVVGAALGMPPRDGTVHIDFAVAEGTRLRKTFTRELVLTACRRDSRHELATWSDRQRVVVVDEYGPLEGQVPESITRSFERIELSHTHDWTIPLVRGGSLDGSVEREGTGELVGARVVFTRDRAEPEVPSGLHEASYAAERVDDPDACVKGLRASADATGLLPWREVAVGDHWFVDVDAFHELCWPSGTLAFVDEQGERLVTPVDERLGRDLDGTFRVELRSIDTVAGARYASLSLRGILESRATFRYEWSVDVYGTKVSYAGSITLDLYASLRGRLLWNLDAGHLDSIEIEGDVTVDQTLGGVRWDVWGRLLGRGASGMHSWTGTLRAEGVFERS